MKLIEKGQHITKNERLLELVRVQVVDLQFSFIVFRELRQTSTIRHKNRHTTAVIFHFYK
jgi:hypothetical protein